MTDTSAAVPADAAPEASDEDVFEQKAVRLAKRERLLAERTDAAGGAYPVSVPVTASIAEVRERFAHLEAGDETGETVSVAGRVVFSRNTGKLCFAALQAGDGSRIQAMVSLAAVGEESLQRWKELVDLGDHVAVTGEVISSRRGELSIMVAEWTIAAKALLPEAIRQDPTIYPPEAVLQNSQVYETRPLEATQTRRRIISALINAHDAR